MMVQKRRRDFGPALPPCLFSVSSRPRPTTAGAGRAANIYPDDTPRGRAINPDTGVATNFPVTRYVTPYSNFSPFGFNGRYLYGRVALNF